MPPLGRILKLLGAAVAFLLYVWVKAVRSVPRVQRRKAARRAAKRRL
jgi:threonine/homoserine/homoserine lactone efflux protein